MTGTTSPANLPASTGRLGSAGVREVLGVAFDGGAVRGDVRALLLGVRIDTRNPPDFVEPDKLTLQGMGSAFAFRYGVFVLFAASPAIEQEPIATLESQWALASLPTNFP